MFCISSCLSSSHFNSLICCAVDGMIPLVRRRNTLPSPCPTSTVSLWNILRNNIGKDLSKVAMPVQLNEPLNTLQRLCEELEYSELLNTANETDDPYQRMVRGKNFIPFIAASQGAGALLTLGKRRGRPVQTWTNNIEHCRYKVTLPCTVLSSLMMCPSASSDCLTIPHTQLLIHAYRQELVSLEFWLTIITEDT